jgi:hypothetical protein
MYKDYRNGEGNSVETIPGFRRRFTAKPAGVTTDYGIKINGIHEYDYITADGTRDKDILVHAGKKIYLWQDIDHSANTVIRQEITLAVDENYNTNKDIVVPFDYVCASVKNIEINGNAYSSATFRYSSDDKTITLFGSTFGRYANKNAIVNYVETDVDALKYDLTNYILLNDAESKSFTFNNRLYILDGQDYWVYDAENKIRKVKDADVYIPTTYKGIGLGEKAPMKAEDFEKIEYEQKNLLCNRFKHSYVADGTTDTYPLYDSAEIIEVRVYGRTLKKGGDDKDYVVNDDHTIKFTEIPKAPTDPSYNGNYDETYPGVVITYLMNEADHTAYYNAISKCTVFAAFDKRVFLTGNPDEPCKIWFCGINNKTGLEDATYFGQLDYVIDGVENAPITGLIPISDTLAALKNHSKQDATIYFHTRMETGSHVAPVTYRSEQGLNGYGCLGACTNFLDDPIFISMLGVEAIEKMTVNLERTIAHRSSLVDSKFVNLLEQNDYKVKVTEWGGYLVILVGDCLFLADSRQMYTSEMGTLQYEWYYVEGVGIYEGQEPEFYYENYQRPELPKEVWNAGARYEVELATHIYNADLGISENLLYTAVTIGQFEAQPFTVTYTYDNVQYTDWFVPKDTWDGKTYNPNSGEPVIIKKAIPCNAYGSFTGGEMKKPTCIATIDDNIFFGTENGIVCSFNFDMREMDTGTISPKYYTFDDRTIYCGIATKMDNCGIPHLTKSTIKKSTVVKTKAMRDSLCKVRVRTNKDGYKSVARLSSNVFSFDTLDFSDFTFVSQEQTIFALKEKEKHWVEKQHWIYSDEFRRPFSVYYIAYRYKVSGRIKD